MAQEPDDTNKSQDCWGDFDLLPSEPSLATQSHFTPYANLAAFDAGPENAYMYQFSAPPPAPVSTPPAPFNLVNDRHYLNQIDHYGIAGPQLSGRRVPNTSSAINRSTAPTGHIFQAEYNATRDFASGFPSAKHFPDLGHAQTATATGNVWDIPTHTTGGYISDFGSENPHLDPRIALPNRGASQHNRRHLLDTIVPQVLFPQPANPTWSGWGTSSDLFNSLPSEFPQPQLQAVPATTFYRFQDLVTELRLGIWKLGYYLFPRVIILQFSSLSPVVNDERWEVLTRFASSPLLSVNRESRGEIRPLYRHIYSVPSMLKTVKPFSLTMSFNIDTLFIENETYVNSSGDRNWYAIDVDGKQLRRIFSHKFAMLHAEVKLLGMHHSLSDRFQSQGFLGFKKLRKVFTVPDYMILEPRPDLFSISGFGPMNGGLDRLNEEEMDDRKWMVSKNWKAPEVISSAPEYRFYDEKDAGSDEDWL